MNVGIYVRVSTQEQVASGYSMTEQEERARAYCAAMGWSIGRVYADGGFSGANMNRPALQQLIFDVAAGSIRKVLVYKLDRLSRSQLDTLYLIEQVFLPAGVDFVSMSESFDTATPFGRAMIGILAVFAQLERDQIRERMSLGMQARVKEGRWHGSNQTPIGYIYEDGMLQQLPEEVDQVRRAFQLCAAGKTVNAIATLFQQEGQLHRFGTWNQVRVREVLRNPVYIGLLRNGDNLVQGLHEPCVETAVFDAVQLILDRRRMASLDHNSTPGKARSLLGGLLVCARCGAKYHKQLRKNGQYKYLLYCCSSRSKKSKATIKDPSCKNKNWRMEELDELVLAEVKKIRYRPAGKSRDMAAGMIERKERSIAGRISRLLDLYAVGGVPLPDLQKKLSALQDQKDRLAAQKKEAAENGRKTAEAAALDTALKDCKKILDSGEIERIRGLLVILINRIEIDGDDVSIFWNFE